MTAILLAGRSGAAFAAEIGTMKVNQEIDALTTMGLDPVKFLVVTRVLAATAMTVPLVVFADLIGLVGGALVMLTFEIPIATYYKQAVSFATLTDFTGGLAKSLVFGVLIAGIGCLRGLQTETGASAVGVSATNAVVSGIILIVFVDGVFAVVYYYLGV
jgi:phospholipid/cholesterol/gamma-HCH transport system permease protein